LEDIPQRSGEEMANDGTMVEGKEQFLPNRIYVRYNVRKTFGLFLNDVGMVEPRTRPTVLTSIYLRWVVLKKIYQS
jgi:hypothetical protein